MEFFTSLTEDHIAFIARQPVFFVATAAKGARINLSPKGMDSFRILSPTQVGYLDVGGSGNETHAHLAADGRITVMMCAFDRPALILRMYGHGRAVLPQDAEWDALVAHFTVLPGTRQIFVIDLDRQTLSKYHAADDPGARLAKIADRTQSIDGLPIRVQTVMPAWTE